LIAEELSAIAEKVRDLDRRMAEVEKVNARLEEAALTTARALGEISGHWDACGVPKSGFRLEIGNFSQC
jgi:hypothetical protein